MDNFSTTFGLNSTMDKAESFEELVDLRHPASFQIEFY